MDEKGEKQIFRAVNSADKVSRLARLRSADSCDRCSITPHAELGLKLLGSMQEQEREAFWLGISARIGFPYGFSPVFPVFAAAAGASSEEIEGDNAALERVENRVEAVDTAERAAKR